MQRLAGFFVERLKQAEIAVELFNHLPMREIVIIPLGIIKSFECAGHFQFSFSKVDGLSNFGAADLRDERGAKLPRHDGMSERVSLASPDHAWRAATANFMRCRTLGTFRIWRSEREARRVRNFAPRWNMWSVHKSRSSRSPSVRMTILNSGARISFPPSPKSIVAWAWSCSQICSAARPPISQFRL